MRRAVATVAAATLLGACTSAGPDAAGDAPLPAAFADGVPAPTGEVVLSITTDGDEAVWDLATLELLEQHELSMVEPFVDVETTFTGPLWVDVLRASGIDTGGDADIELRAIDDYVIVLPTDATAIGGTLLATGDAGEPIPVEFGGPVRLVFPDDVALGDNLNHWIWSLRWGEVR